MMLLTTAHVLWNFVGKLTHFLVLLVW